MTKITIVIITFNRLKLLEKCIESLSNALSVARDKFSFQVSVLVNGIDEKSHSWLQQNYAVNEVVMIKTLNPGAARNRLLNVPRETDWFFFLDDDAFVPDDLFLNFHELLKKTQYDIYGGPNLTPEGSSLFQKTVGEVLASPFGSYLSSQRYRPALKPHICDDKELTLCNLFVKKELVLKNIFPESLVCAEENFVLATFLEKNHKAYFDKTLFVWHERRQGFLHFLKQVFIYGIGRGQVIKMRPRFTRPMNLLPSLGILLFMAILGLSYYGMRQPSLLLKVYILLTILFSYQLAKTMKPHFWRPLFLSMPLFVGIHFSYGLGVIWGLSIARK